MCCAVNPRNKQLNYQCSPVWRDWCRLQTTCLHCCTCGAVHIPESRRSSVGLVFLGPLRLLIHPFSLLPALKPSSTAEKVEVGKFTTSILTSMFSCQHPCEAGSLVNVQAPSTVFLISTTMCSIVFSAASKICSRNFSRSASHLFLRPNSRRLPSPAACLHHTHPDLIHSIRVLHSCVLCNDHPAPLVPLQSPLHLHPQQRRPTLQAPCKYAWSTCCRERCTS